MMLSLPEAKSKTGPRTSVRGKMSYGKIMTLLAVGMGAVSLAGHNIAASQGAPAVQNTKPEASQNSAAVEKISPEGPPEVSALQEETNSLPPLSKDITLDEGPYLRALDKIEFYLRALDGFKANFRQYSASGDSVSGVLYLKRPGHVRFDYEGNAPFLMVSDGETLSFIDYEIGQVSRWPMAESPLGVLFGAKGREDNRLRLDIAALGGQIQLNPAGFEQHIALRLQDKEKPEQGILTAFFKEVGEGLELVSWVVEDAQSRITVVEISNPENGLELSDTLWHYKDPRGLARRRGKRS